MATIQPAISAAAPTEAPGAAPVSEASAAPVQTVTPAAEPEGAQMLNSIRAEAASTSPAAKAREAAKADNKGLAKQIGAESANTADRLIAQNQQQQNSAAVNAASSSPAADGMKVAAGVFGLLGAIFSFIFPPLGFALGAVGAGLGIASSQMQSGAKSQGEAIKASQEQGAPAARARENIIVEAEPAPKQPMAGAPSTAAAMTLA